jgi:hypothetical protein
VASCCEYGDEPSSSSDTELVSYVVIWLVDWSVGGWLVSYLIGWLVS